MTDKLERIMQSIVRNTALSTTQFYKIKEEIKKELEDDTN